MATQHAKRKTWDESSAEHNVLEITNTSVAFAMEHGNTRVLDDASISVRRGEVLGVVDESGSGESMLADSMFDAIDSPGTFTGDVVFNPSEGSEPTRVNELSKEELRRLRWERVSTVAQGALDSFSPTLSIGDHFVETPRARDYDVQEGMEHARQLVSDVRLEPDRVLDVYPHELSGGMKQHALIAPSLIPDPDVLVVDEPTTALNLLMQQSIPKLLPELKTEYDLIIVIVMHDLSHVARISDHLAVMYTFELLELGPVQDIVMDPAHPYMRELLNSIPDIDADLDEVASIEGTNPDPLNVPKGCSYHTRCPLADERCRAANPDLMEVSDDHGAACFYTDEACETIPLKKEVSKRAPTSCSASTA